MMLNIPVVETNNAIALLVQPCRTRQVILNLLRMGIAVNFDHQPASSTIKVYDEPINRVLTSEFEAAKLLVAQVCPELALDRCLWLAQLARVSKNGRIDAVLVFGHFVGLLLDYPLTPALSPSGRGSKSPSPQPSPLQGEGASLLHPSPLPFREREQVPLTPALSPSGRGSARPPLPLRERGRGEG
jgi:hypothetical protein